MMLDVRVFRSSNVVSDRHSLVDEPPSVLILSDQQEMKTEAVTVMLRAEYKL